MGICIFSRPWFFLVRLYAILCTLSQRALPNMTSSELSRSFPALRVWRRELTSVGFLPPLQYYPSRSGDKTTRVGPYRLTRNILLPPPKTLPSSTPSLLNPFFSSFSVVADASYSLCAQTSPLLLGFQKGKMNSTRADHRTNSSTRPSSLSSRPFSSSPHSSGISSATSLWAVAACSSSGVLAPRESRRG